MQYPTWYPTFIRPLTVIGSRPLSNYNIILRELPNKLGDIPTSDIFGYRGLRIQQTW